MDELQPIEIILGTYEEYLLGYKYFPKNLELKPTFNTHSHSSSIRSVCVSGNYLASAGADDRIFVYDLKLRKEHCVLTHHNATINCLAFTPGHTHLLSGSADGVLAIVRVGNWQLEKIWEKPHKGSAVLSIAIHSSGKLALTLGADRSLSTWNLVKGRQAYVINLNSKSKDPKSLEHVVWAPCGVRFVLSGGKYTEIWSIEKGGILNAIEHPTKVTCCTWLSNNSLLVGYEDGKLSVVDTDSEKIKTYDGHNSRVKAVACCEKYIVTAASSGDIKIWNKDLKNIHECSACCKCNSECRITCLCLSTFQGTNNDGKIETKEESESDDETESVEECKPIIAKIEIEGESDSEPEVKIIPMKKRRKNRH